MMHHILLFILAVLARSIIARHKPYVIGVTGTVGKTTISTSIATYLTLAFSEEKVGYSKDHYNGEYGLPLTIIGAKTGGKNIFLWILVFFTAFRRYLGSYPKYLVLEYGIDHPGEMEYLLSIVRPDIAILSPVAPNHLEQFGTFDRYLRAKLLLVESARSHALVHESLRGFISREVYYYGRQSTSDIFVDTLHQSIDALEGNIHFSGKIYDLSLPVFGLYQMENILPVYIVACILGTNEGLISLHPEKFLPEPGRSRILEGIGGSKIIDGSYNGGYESICRGIDSVLPFLETHRIIFLLGDMRELGEQTAEIHRQLAEYIEKSFSERGNISFFLVGPLMREYVSPLLHGYARLESDLSSRKLGKAIRDLLENDEKPTIIYVKGSQNTIFLEEGIKEILRDSSDRALLSRQSSSWMKTKEAFFESLDKK